MKKRWEFFSEDDLRCKGTGEINMNEEFMKKLVALRKELDQHMNIISGYRHMAYNDVIYSSVYSLSLPYQSPITSANCESSNVSALYPL